MFTDTQENAANVQEHTACIAMDHLQKHRIQTMDWPSLSPNLNPMEHIWDMLDLRAFQKGNVGTNFPNSFELYNIFTSTLANDTAVLPKYKGPAKVLRRLQKSLNLSEKNKNKAK